MKKILALDLGAKTGWCYVDKVGEESGAFEEKTFTEWYNKIKELVDLYKPEIIVCSQTNNFGFMNATRKMFMRFGIVCLLGERVELPVIEFSDSEARKQVLGKLKYTKDQGIKRKEVAQIAYRAMFPESINYTEDQIDACVLAKGYYKLN